MWPGGGHRGERLLQRQCMLQIKLEDEVGLFIPAILNSGGGQRPDCEGPDGLELPGLITAVSVVSIHSTSIEIEKKTYASRSFLMVRK